MTNIQEFQIVKETCGYCGKLISNPYEGHKSCVRRAREMHASKMAQDGMIEKQVDEVEEYLKRHPDGPCVGRDGLTYNQRLAKQEKAKKEVELQNLRDKADRKKQLNLLERRLEALKSQIERDVAEEAEEARSYGNP